MKYDLAGWHKMAQKIVNIRVDEDKWERFKKIAKANESDASKEVRKFINKYLSENAQLHLEIQK
jgi:antitoxin component of RelBE/YafQ-DinJ toxin-antitoxin module